MNVPLESPTIFPMALPEKLVLATVGGSAEVSK